MLDPRWSALRMWQHPAAVETTCKTKNQAHFTEIPSSILVTDTHAYNSRSRWLYVGCPRIEMCMEFGNFSYHSNPLTRYISYKWRLIRTCLCKLKLLWTWTMALCSLWLEQMCDRNLTTPCNLGLIRHHLYDADSITRLDADMLWNLYTCYGTICPGFYVYLAGWNKRNLLQYAQIPFKPTWRIWDPNKQFQIKPSKSKSRYQHESQSDLFMRDNLSSENELKNLSTWDLFNLQI